MDHRDLKSSSIDCGLQLDGGEAAPTADPRGRPKSDLGWRLTNSKTLFWILYGRCPKATSYHLEATTRA